MDARTLLAALVLLAAFAARADRVPGEWIVTNPDGKVSLVKGEPALRALPDGARVQPNFRYHAFAVRVTETADPRFGESWGLRNDGQAVGDTPGGTPGKDIAAVPAWDVFPGDGRLVVAVIDTGVDLGHEDLQQAIWTNPGEIPDNGVDDDGNGYVDDVHGWNADGGNGNVQDAGSHGTFCAGLVAADAGNGKGTRGVARAKVMAVRFLDKAGQGTTAGAIAAIDYAAKNGARVINASWGGTEYDQALSDAVKRAGDAGALFVAAAGNDGGDNDVDAPIYPASFRLPNVISVAAYDSRDRLAAFSNFGKSSVHLGAPGVAILSTTPGGYRLGDGTSFAAPFVSGVAALLLAYVPTLSVTAARERLLQTSEVIGYYEKERTATAGRVHALNALLDRRPPRPQAPASWRVDAADLQSEHPYANHTAYRETVRRPGAGHVRVHFSRLDTEKRVDKVTLRDAAGEVVAVYSGKRDAFWSADAVGDTVVVEFESDATVTGWGFSIDQAGAAP